MTNHKHLTTGEIEKLLATIQGSRHELRDRCLLLLMFRHGLRVPEACGFPCSHAPRGNGGNEEHRL